MIRRKGIDLFTKYNSNTIRYGLGGVGVGTANQSSYIMNSPSLIAVGSTSKRNLSFLSDDGRRYHWITAEAEDLIDKAYARHSAIADKSKSFPPALSVKDLESLEKPFHYKPKSAGDHVARGVVKVLEKLMAMFFREKYDHHAVTLETLAAVPGVVASAFRHLKSLRSMQRDHGWINPLQEEAENERMHLLIWMQHTKPSRLERTFVITSQAAYVVFYAFMYAVSPRTAHRAVGYLEECAHTAYTEYLEAVDAGNIPNVPASEIAKKYYRLKDDATLRDVILHVRADECMHRDFNHHLADLHLQNQASSFPVTMREDLEAAAKRKQDGSSSN